MYTLLQWQKYLNTVQHCFADNQKKHLLNKKQHLFRKKKILVETNSKQLLIIDFVCFFKHKKNLYFSYQSKVILDILDTFLQ